MKFNNCYKSSSTSRFIITFSQNLDQYKRMDEAFIFITEYLKVATKGEGGKSLDVFPLITNTVKQGHQTSLCILLI